MNFPGDDAPFLFAHGLDVHRQISQLRCLIFGLLIEACVGYGDSDLAGQ